MKFLISSGLKCKGKGIFMVVGGLGLFGFGEVHSIFKERNAVSETVAIRAVNLDHSVLPRV
jgi:hypothetical protein